MIAETLLTPARASETAAKVKEHVRGAPLPESTAGLPTFSPTVFDELKEAVTKAKTAVDKDPRDAVAAGQLAFAAAVHRDMRYSHAGRRYLMKLGLNNKVRGAFEGGRIALDNNIEA